MTCGRRSTGLAVCDGLIQRQEPKACRLAWQVRHVECEQLSTTLIEEVSAKVAPGVGMSSLTQGFDTCLYCVVVWW